jgi:hypothetical protein
VEPEAPVYGDYERLFSFPQRYAARGQCATANWVSPRSLLLSIGGFNAQLKSGGDGRMARRIRSTGRPLIYVPSMLVHHPVRATRDELIRKRQRLCGGRWQRTPGPGRFLRAAGVTAWSTLRRIRRAAVSRELPVRRRLAVMRLSVTLGAVAVRELWHLRRGAEARRE